MDGWLDGGALENTRLEFSSQVFPEAGATKHNCLPVLPGNGKLKQFFCSEVNLNVMNVVSVVCLCA